MTFADAFYRRSPPWLQTGLLNLYALRFHRRRYGGLFSRLQADWEESQWWSSDQIRGWQDQRVTDMVRFAHAKVPYYARLYSAHGVNVRQIQGVADLPKLPTITKSDVRQWGPRLLAPCRDPLVHGHTSGTTGSPLSLYYDRDMCVANAVADWRQKRWGGMGRDDWYGVLLGRVIVPTEQSRPPFWRANFVHRQLWLSSFHMSDENLGAYVGQCRRRRLRFLEGYPSTLYILAQYVLRARDQLPMRAVFTSSETLHPVQREAITSAFQCPVFDFYGLAERVIFAGQCGKGDGKHLFDEYGVTELIDDDGRLVANGQNGWLVGTSLWNRGMPLIRYRTADLSLKLSGTCPCGRELGRLASVTTKAEDIVVTPDGRFVSPSVLTHPFKPFDQILRSQLVQTAPDHVLVRIVPSRAFTEEHRTALEASLRARLGPAIRIETVLTDEIPREPSGKFRWVISHVPHSCSLRWEP